MLRKAVRQGLGAAVAQRPLQHEPAQGSDDAAHRQRCAAWPGMAGPRPQGRLERSSRVPYRRRRSEEHTSELQSLMRISYAVFCLKKKTNKNKVHNHECIPSKSNTTPHKSHCGNQHTMTTRVT